MQDKIIKLLQEREYVPSNVATIRKSLRLKPANERELDQSLKHLEQRGEIAQIKGSRYIIPSEADLVPGRIQMTRQGRGFLIPDDEKLEELAIPAEATGTALHEDRVLVRRESKGFGGRAEASVKPSGSVVRVLERRRSQFVGNLQRSRQFLFVVPDDSRIPCDIYVPEPRDLGRPARVGDKVVVELLEWQSRHTNPEGEIIEVLGPPNQEGVDMLAIIRQHELPLKFPRKVLQEVKNLGKTVTDE
ncbi:MAG: ribonuclease R, partial [Verrucomicrobia bacterium]|nr:ribonuclease R [Verrucomicrobiota bacterium]